MNDRPDPERTDAMSSRSRGRVARIAAELVGHSRRSSAALVERIEQLTPREIAELALQLPPLQRIELLLHAPLPLRLVRSLPDTDLYLTVREVGPAEALPLIALASHAQLQHLQDLEAWRGDRFDADRAGAWVALYLEAGEPALRRFLRHVDDDWLGLLCHRWMRLHPLEFEDGAEKHGHGQSETGTAEGAMSPDGNYRFSPSIPEHMPAVARVLRMLFVESPERYRRVTWDSVWELPFELEERALQWRQSRLEEHGFPAFDEALSVYAPPVQAAARPDPPQSDNPDALLGPRTTLSAAPPLGVLASGLDTLDDETRDRVLFELLSLANHLLVAGRIIEDRSILNKERKCFLKFRAKRTICQVC